MKTRACPFPEESALNVSFARSADHVDAFVAPLSDLQRSLPEIFHGIFGHRPYWLRALFATRNVAAKACGLATTPLRETLRPRATLDPKVGDTLGGWNVYTLGTTELVVGRDNPHMDFRVSISKPGAGLSRSVVVATVCRTKNSFGRLYLAGILPFHERGLRLLMDNAVSGGRL